MNRNTIISLAMLYALWQSNRQDLLDLIRPFVLYAVGNTAKINTEIDIALVCDYMEKEFGYRSIQVAVINRILSREASSKGQKDHRCIERKNKQFILIKSLSNEIDDFSAKRTTCKGHSDAVTSALTNFLNDKQVCKRTNYTQAEAERLLLSFFERQGGSIVLSVEDLRQLKARSNEIDFFIARFILAEYERKTVLFDYLVELVKGYFVTTALYLQAENPNATTASFSDVTFFLDTRLLLAYLGYKTEEENSSVQKMVESLKKTALNLLALPIILMRLTAFWRHTNFLLFRSPSVPRHIRSNILMQMDILIPMSRPIRKNLYSDSKMQVLAAFHLIAFSMMISLQKAVQAY